MAFDAIIVGAGVIGASIAWRLSQSGLRVLLLDAARMGGEASSAGAGMLAPAVKLNDPRRGSTWQSKACGRTPPSSLNSKKRPAAKSTFNASERWS